MPRPWPRTALVPAAACLVAIVCIARWHRGEVPRQPSGGFQQQERSSTRSRRLKDTQGIADTLCEQSCLGCSFSGEPAEPVFDLKADFLMIFSYGKVGSTTLRSSMASSVLNFTVPVYLKSGLDSGLPNQMSTELLQREETALPQFVKTHSSGAAKIYLSRVPAGRRVWIITACRNPFTYLISLFWQKFKDKKFEWSKGLDSSNMFSKTAVSMILDHFSREAAGGLNAARWFSESDLGFRPGVGLNLAACGGKFSEGSLYIDRVVDGVRQSIILLRLEDIKRWPAILGKNGMPGFRLVESKNTRDQYSHHILADAVDAALVWPEEDVRGILRWDTWEFYTVQEKMAMLRDLKTSF